MKLLLQVISLILLAIGCIGKEEPLVIAGAFVFIFTLIIDTFDVYQMAKRSKNDNDSKKKEDEENSPKITNNVPSWIFGAIGLGAFGFGQLAKDNDIYTLSGCIIWVGLLFFYFLNGIIIQNVTGIELRMGYGGWYIPKKRNKSHPRYDNKKKRS